MLLPLLTQTVETVLDDIGGQDGMGQHFSETPLILSLVPTPLLVGLGLLVVSACIVVALEYRADRERAERYSAARS